VLTCGCPEDAHIAPEDAQGEKVSTFGKSEHLPRAHGDVAVLGELRPAEVMDLRW
jgi:hypothetical protein